MFKSGSPADSRILKCCSGCGGDDDGEDDENHEEEDDDHHNGDDVGENDDDDDDDDDGDDGSIYHLYNTYILPSGGLYATYHLLREPETTIDKRLH